MKLVFENKKRMNESSATSYLYDCARQALGDVIYNCREDGLTPDEISSTIKQVVKDLLYDWFG